MNRIPFLPFQLTNDSTILALVLLVNQYTDTSPPSSAKLRLQSKEKHAPSHATVKGSWLS